MQRMGLSTAGNVQAIDMNQIMDALIIRPLVFVIVFLAPADLLSAV